MKRIVMAGLLLVSAGTQATCYELHNANDDVISATHEPPFSSPESIAKRASVSRGEYVTAHPGQCARIIDRKAPVATAPSPSRAQASPPEDLQGPACQAPDGRWYHYGSRACDPIATSVWLQKDLDFLELYQSFLDACARGIDIEGRTGEMSEECVTVQEARPRMLATRKKVLALPEGTLTSAQMRVLLELSESQQEVTESLKGARPLDIRIVE